MSAFMNAYAERLGHLASGQLRAALDRFDLGRLVSTTPVTTGNFGQNVFLTASTGDYVFRGHPLRDEQFAKERYFAQVLHERTSVPVPWPYHHERDRDLFGWEYAIMPRLDGVHLAEPDAYDNLADDDRSGIAVAMAHTLPACNQPPARSPERTTFGAGRSSRSITATTNGWSI